MNYPLLRDELLAMLKQDQKEVRAQSKAYKRAPKGASTKHSRGRLAVRSLERAERVMEILDEIGLPTIDNIGVDGSQAVSVLTIHSRLSIMKKTLRLFEKCYEQDPSSIYHEAIPALTDWILILERKKQRYGTQWMIGADGTFFLPQVENFKNINKLRAKYGLHRIRQPRDLTYGTPKGPPPLEAQQSDQRPLEQEEYDDIALEYLG
jgi:hypothetical protein